jgi:hypothetical protein
MSVGSSVRDIPINLPGLVLHEDDVLGLAGATVELVSVRFNFSFSIFRVGRGSSCETLLEAVSFVFENNSRATGKTGTNG